jgi:hypothetical protein
LHGQVKFRLENGNVRFASDGTIKIDELDIDWDRLFVQFDFDINTICTPRICLPDWLGGGCTPRWCFFEGSPDFSIPINIPAVFNSEVSIDVRPKAYYGLATPSNKWLIVLEPVGPVDIDIIDVADTVGDILDNAISAAVAALGIPDFVADILGSMVDVIRDLLDIADDVGEWIKDLVFQTLGIELGIDNLIFNWLTDTFDLPVTDDPIRVTLPPLPAGIGPAGGCPISVAVTYLEASVDAAEMVLGADLEE